MSWDTFLKSLTLIHCLDNLSVCDDDLFAYLLKIVRQLMKLRCHSRKNPMPEQPHKWVPFNFSQAPLIETLGKGARHECMDKCRWVENHPCIWSVCYCSVPISRWTTNQRPTHSVMPLMGRSAVCRSPCLALMLLWLAAVYILLNHCNIFYFYLRQGGNVSNQIHGFFVGLSAS